MSSKSMAPFSLFSLSYLSHASLKPEGREKEK